MDTSLQVSSWLLVLTCTSHKVSSQHDSYSKKKIRRNLAL